MRARSARARGAPCLRVRAVSSSPHHRVRSRQLAPWPFPPPALKLGKNVTDLSIRTLVILVYFRLFAQHRVQQRSVNLDLALVIDEALFPESIHEEADPGPGGADHFRQRLLAERDRNGLR